MMKHILLIISTFISAINLAQTKKLFSTTPNQIINYRLLAQKAWDVKDSIKASSYDDSIKSCIENSVIDNYNFQTADSLILNTSKITKPIFLLTSASWCSPCMAEIKPLNRIVEQYADSVHFIILFWDTKDKLSSMAAKYNTSIALIPSSTRENIEDNSINISGFKHLGGYPATYLIVNNKIIDYSEGAVSTSVAVLNSKGQIETITIATEEKAFESNYELLKSKVEKLLHNSYR